MGLPSGQKTAKVQIIMAHNQTAAAAKNSAPPVSKSMPEERVRELAKALAKSGLTLLDALDELDRAEKNIIEEVIQGEEKKKIVELKKRLGGKV